MANGTLDLVHLHIQVLGFGEYIEEVYAAYEQHRLETIVSSTSLSLSLIDHIYMHRTHNTACSFYHMYHVCIG